MRILHVTPYYRPAYAFGGVVRSAEGMAKALAARGHELTVLTTDALSPGQSYAGPRDEILDAVRVLRCANALPVLRARLNLSTPLGMRGLAGEALASADIVHLHELRTLENLLVMPLAARKETPVALSPHGTLDLRTGRGAFKRAWDRLLGAGLAKRVDHVIALTANEASQARSHWARLGAMDQTTGFSIVPNGVELGEFSSLPPAADFRERHGLGAAPTVLYMGRLQARKGVDLLIEAFRAADVSESRLLIAGPDEGLLPRLKRLAAGDERISFAGYLDGSARLQAFAAADVFALPARGEGQSMAALEAMAAGLPALLSPGCNMDEVAAAGAGYVVEATVEAFADKLGDLLRQAELRREMGRRARQLVEARYSWDKVAAALERVYARLV